MSCGVCPESWTRPDWTPVAPPVVPLTRAIGSARLPRSILTVWVFPTVHASCSGCRPKLLHKTGDAAASSSRCMTLASPATAAMCTTPRPVVSRVLSMLVRGTPAISSTSAQRQCLLEQAARSAAARSLPRSLAKVMAASAAWGFLGAAHSPAASGAGARSADDVAECVRRIAARSTCPCLPATMSADFLWNCWMVSAMARMRATRVIGNTRASTLSKHLAIRMWYTMVLPGSAPGCGILTLPILSGACSSGQTPSPK
mmetsp:Transcript_47488/g.134066  ORF Transcript_47488/g.134066 Transcript_47488/m.134066 type:complete len:258 (-) Transcript_47488:933-1706(-)